MPRATRQHGSTTITSFAASFHTLFFGRSISCKRGVREVADIESNLQSVSQPVTICEREALPRQNTNTNSHKQHDVKKIVCVKASFLFPWFLICFFFLLLIPFAFCIFVVVASSSPLSFPFLVSLIFRFLLLLLLFSLRVLSAGG